MTDQEEAAERVRKFADLFHRRYGERFTLVASVSSPDSEILVLRRTDLDLLLGIDRQPKKKIRITRRNK